MLVFRKAGIKDTENLSGLAFESEKYLGYDSDYMSKFADLYNVSESFISQCPVYVMEMDGEILGFWGLSEADHNEVSPLRFAQGKDEVSPLRLAQGQDWELEFFYISVDCIGKGYGRKLWNHLTAECKKQGITEFRLVTSPQSAAFYEKMGAMEVKQVESLVTKGRMIPQLKFIVSET